ncbi:ABC transporter substrate-binding protein [Gardnerella vaginalis]|uniref:ABC transporter substrate-binding protein n=1 Tax=Gardnerella TaxID=2701 RepID=UPI000352D181|nr:ABC transporter, substrate-binding protein, family 5 [Gardnerella vaginalis JCP8481A]EPI43608.1 ABC transporter, substrate-binding protein, family 5 [Gardnerella vaginalis JCP8481B]
MSRTGDYEFAASNATHHKSTTGWIPWVVFIVVSVVMIGVLWCGWQMYQGHSPIEMIAHPAGNSVLKVGLRTAPDSLDIRTDDSDALQQALLDNVYETLVKRGDDNSLRPGLAQSWNVSKDGLVYSFNLRQGVHFSNGDSMNSESVLQSLQQGITKNYPGYSALTNIKTVTNPDDTTLEITLHKPDALLLRRLSGRAGIVYDTKAVVDYSSSALGTGPFIVNSYSKGNSLVLLRNNRYWGSPAVCASITLQYFANDTALAEAMEHGNIQMAVPLEGNENKRLAAIANTQMVDGQSTRVRFIAINTTVASIFCDEQARKAVAYAVNPQTVIASDGNGGVLVGGPIDPLSTGYEDLTGIYQYNPNKAASLFHYFSASYLGTITFLVPQGEGNVGRELSKQISSVSGFKINLEEVNQSTLQQRVNEGKYDIALATMNHTLDQGAFAENGSPFVLQDARAQQAWANAVHAKNASEYETNARAYAREVVNNNAARWLYARKSVMAVKTNVSGYAKNMTDQLLPLHDVNVK